MKLNYKKIKHKNGYYTRAENPTVRAIDRVMFGLNDLITPSRKVTNPSEFKKGKKKRERR
jgi:hypothetical protein